MQQRLQQRVRAARGGEGGFTLIELLIVIVILGVLAGIVVFSVNFIQDRGEKTACQADVKNVQTAVEAYIAQTPGNTYPDTAGLDTALYPNYLKTKPSAMGHKIEIDGDGVVFSTDC